MARPCSRVRPLETPGNRRPREMIVAPLTRGTEPGLRAFSGARFQFGCVPGRSCDFFHTGSPERILDVMTFATLVHAIAHALGMAFAMFWEILWVSAIHRIGCGRLLRAGRSCPRSPHACRA